MNETITMQEKIAFYQSIVGVSMEIEQKTGGKYLAATHMVQAANETGYFADGCWRGINGWKGKMNLTGISPNGQIADFATWDEYVAAFVKVIETNGFGYPHILDMGASGVVAQIEALGASKWNVNHYIKDGKLGGVILAVWESDSRIVDQVINAYEVAHHQVEEKQVKATEEKKELSESNQVKMMIDKLKELMDQLVAIYNELSQTS